MHEVEHGDSLLVLAGLPEAVFDSCVTDPPYGLSFMGKKWDYDVPKVELWREVYRVLKPGAFVLAFFGTRTYHRGVVAVEDAGFEIRDQLGWMYGSGFPKSMDVSKAIDAAAGAVREVIGPPTRHAGQSFQWANENRHPTHTEEKCGVTAPATENAKKWVGWGTALKPAWEPIVLARKPFDCTVAENVLTHGTGALNIDGCRVAHKEVLEPKPGGRWPANVILGHADGCEEDNCGDGCPLKMVDEQSGHSVSRVGKPRGTPKKGLFANGKFNKVGREHNDSGGASRFFYCAKAAKSERGKGNNHPTVKPVELMKYLCRLVTPPGGVILDPFCGSGTTGIAAKVEGFEFVGIEREQAYVEMARKRIAQ